MRISTMDLYYKNQYTDVELECTEKARDGKTFNLYYCKYMLACRFEYFSTLFGTDLHANKDTVTLQIDHITMKALIENSYARGYDGTDPVVESRVLKRLLHAMDYLQMKDYSQLVVAKSTMKRISDLVFPTYEKYIALTSLTEFADSDDADCAVLHYTILNYVSKRNTYLKMLTHYVDTCHEPMKLANLVFAKTRTINANASRNTAQQKMYFIIAVLRIMRPCMSPEAYYGFSKQMMLEIPDATIVITD